MKYPDIMTIHQAIALAKAMSREVEKDHWEPCRPEGFPSFWHRIKATWLVFTGKADALTWPRQ